MFKKFVKELLAAQSKAEIISILYGENGIDRMFQKERISSDEHEMLFDLAGKIESSLQE